MGTCYSCNSRHSSPKSRVASVDCDHKPQPEQRLQLSAVSSPLSETPEASAEAVTGGNRKASSSGYVTGKSPVDTSASRYSDDTWNSEKNSHEEKRTLERPKMAGRKSLFDVPAVHTQLKCDLNLNNRPRLTSDYANSSQAKVFHSQPQSYATRRGILSYRRLEPMFPKVEPTKTETKDANENVTRTEATTSMATTSSTSTSNGSVPSTAPATKTFFRPSDVKNDMQAISNVLEFLKSPTAVVDKNANAAPSTAPKPQIVSRSPRPVRPTTLENLKPCTPKMPVKFRTNIESGEPSYRSPRMCRRTETAERPQSPKRQMSPLRITERNRSPVRADRSSPARYDRNRSPLRQAAERTRSPVRYESRFSTSVSFQRVSAAIGSPPGSPRMDRRTHNSKSPLKSPVKTPLSHQSSQSLNSDILEKVEGLIDDDFVDQPSLIASSKNSLDSETSRCSMNLTLGMNRSMLMYHELARIKEQLLILRTTLEHCQVDEPDGSDDLRRQLVLLTEELKDRDATIRKLQNELSSSRPQQLGERATRNIAVQTQS